MLRIYVHVDAHVKSRLEDGIALQQRIVRVSLFSATLLFEVAVEVAVRCGAVRCGAVRCGAGEPNSTTMTN
jgi:hypothetical protein